MRWCQIIVLLTLLTLLIFDNGNTEPIQKARIIVQRAYLTENELLYRCEGLANYLNSVQSEFDFECLYKKAEEILAQHPSATDILITSPVLFTRIEAKISKEERGIFPFYNVYRPDFGWEGRKGAVFFTKKDSTINELKDLKGKKLACVGEQTGCALLFLYELHKVKIPENKVLITFTGSWEKVVKAVLEGRADAGAVRTGVLEYYAKKGIIDLSEIKILNKKNYQNFPHLVSTELIPDWFISSYDIIDHRLYSILTHHLSSILLGNKKIPNSDMLIHPPKNPFKILDIQRILLKGPFASLKAELRKKLVNIALIISTITLIIVSILSLLVFKLKKVNQEKSMLLEELRVLNLQLEERVAERTKLLEEALQKLTSESAKFSTVFKEMDIGLCIVDDKGTIIEHNPKFLHLLRGEKLIGKNIWEILHIDDEKKRSFCWRFEEYIPVEDEVVISTPDGGKLYLQIKIIPIQTLGENHMLISLIDITAQKQLQEEAIRSSQHEALRTIASGLAHDLNNLLLAIANNLELFLLKHNNISEEMRLSLERIKSLSFRAKTLTSELLVLGKGLILNPKAESLPNLLREIAEITLSGSAVECHFSFDERANYVKIDRSALSIALTNLILNARQAMEDRGQLFITTKSTDDKVLIEIRDTGPGIPQEVKDRLFQPFVTTKPSGSGLGLYSAKRIIEAHGGEIFIESELGQGTTVKVYLPKSEEMLLPETKDTPVAEIPKPSKEKPKRILLMDDEAEVRESLAELLSELGYEVRACERGEEAVELYRREGPFDLVILDYTVPGRWNGVETFRELLKVDPKVKAILATGYGHMDTLLSAKEEGFKEVLIKPFSLTELLEVIKKA